MSTDPMPNPAPAPPTEAEKPAIDAVHLVRTATELIRQGHEDHEIAVYLVANGLTTAQADIAVPKIRAQADK